MKNKLFYIALLLLVPQFAFAQTQTIEGIVNNLFTGGHLFSLSKLLEGISYLGGIGLGMKGIFKLQEWNESKGRQVKLSTALIYIICAGLMLGLPTLISVGSQTFLGSDANTSFNSNAGKYGGQY